MKKKRKFWLIVLIILSTIGIYVGTLCLVNAIRTPKVVSEINNMEVTKTPTIDFVQPYLFAHEEGEEFDYDKYFNELSSLGYDTIIVQYTRSEDYVDYDDTSKGLCQQFYYPTNIDEVTDMVIDRTYEYVLEELLTACDNHNFDCYVGLSVEEISWWALTCYYDKDYMAHCADTDCYMIKELKEIVKNHECFIGWYYAFELFSNPVGWEKLWAKNVKQVIETVEEEYDAPVMMSPFRQIQLGLITDEYLMWNSFFKRAGLRENKDIFCPQDSIGKLDSSGDPLTGENHTEITESNLRRVYDYVEQCAKACNKYGIKYYVNCELFRAVEGESSYLFVSDAKRVEWQLKNASRYAEKIVTFSASHYLIWWEEGGIDTLENRQQFLSDYKEMLNK